MSSDFDRRQILQMKKMIGLLKEGKIRLSKFVSDQWSLVEMLDSIDLSWKKEYFSLVDEIEDLYSSSVELGEKQIDHKDVATIDEILRKMLNLIDSQLPRKL